MKALFQLIILCAVFALNAQPVLTPEKLWQIERLYGVEVSPDGKQVIYLQKSYDLEANSGKARLYKMNPDGSSKQAISDESESIISAQWRPDGKKIGYLSSKSGSVQFWEMNPDGSGVVQVTDFEFSISNVHYAPDLKHISFSYERQVGQTLAQKHSDLPEASGRSYDDLMFRHWTQWYDHMHSHVAYISYSEGKISGGMTDIMGDEPYDSPLKPFGGSEQISWNGDGSKIIYTKKEKFGKDYAISTNSDLYSYDLKTKETTNLTEGMMGYDMDPVISPDGQKMAWMSMEREGFESDKNVVWIMDMKSMKRSSLTADVDQSFGHLIWANDGKTIYATSGIEATYQAYELKLNKTQDGLSEAPRQITKGIHNINSIALAGDRLIGTKNTMTAPAEIFSWSIADGSEKTLTDVNSEITKALSAIKVEKEMIKTSDGKDMLTWVIYPPDFRENKKYPTLLYCQGGPQSAISQFFSYRWNFALMAAQGYIVVAPNRRGLPTFGQKWNDDISGDWGGQAMKDYLSAIDAMSEKPFVDSEKLGAVGASYGGYSVYYLAGIHEKRFKTFISHCGLYNLESWYASTEELFFANWDIGGPYWESPQPASYAKFSPHKLVQNWDTPIMVIHNELDFRVPLNQGLEAFTAAQLQGIPSKLLYYPDEGHWVLQPQNGVMWHREFFSWLDRWLKED